jgi:hypothetical protein
MRETFCHKKLALEDSKLEIDTTLQNHVKDPSAQPNVSALAALQPDTLHIECKRSISLNPARKPGVVVPVLGGLGNDVESSRAPLNSPSKASASPPSHTSNRHTTIDPLHTVQINAYIHLHINPKNLHFIQNGSRQRRQHQGVLPGQQ